MEIFILSTITLRAAIRARRKQRLHVKYNFLFSHAERESTFRAVDAPFQFSMAHDIPRKSTILALRSHSAPKKSASAATEMKLKVEAMFF
jgi:hypothetical protein